MFRSLTPNSPLKKLSSPPFSFFLQNVHPLSLNLFPCLRIQNTTTAMASKMAPPTPTTTPTTILLVLLNPPDDVDVELSDAAEGSELDIVWMDVWVTTMVRPLANELNVVTTADDEAATVVPPLLLSLVDDGGWEVSEGVDDSSEVEEVDTVEVAEAGNEEVCCCEDCAAPLEEVSCDEDVSEGTFELDAADDDSSDVGGTFCSEDVESDEDDRDVGFSVGLPKPREEVFGEAPADEDSLLAAVLESLADVPDTPVAEAPDDTPESPETADEKSPAKEESARAFKTT